MEHKALPAVGDEIPAVRVDDVSADKIKIMALIFRDPNPIHFDTDAVRAAGLGDRYVNQGGVTMAYAINMLIAWAGSRSAIRSVTCRFQANVFEGDSIEVGGTVTDVQTIADDTTVTCDIWARLADQPEATTVIGGTATVAWGTK
ncbi:hypothetical protein GKZ92_20400 [Gordonia sp. 135]|nr:hypothetical protein GKZ92_20400 [Gordonia sp. 135]